MIFLNTGITLQYTGQISSPFIRHSPVARHLSHTLRPSQYIGRVREIKTGCGAWRGPHVRGLGGSFEHHQPRSNKQAIKSRLVPFYRRLNDPTDGRQYWEVWRNTSRIRPTSKHNGRRRRDTVGAYRVGRSVERNVIQRRSRGCASCRSSSRRTDARFYAHLVRRTIHVRDGSRRGPKTSRVAHRSVRGRVAFGWSN